MLVSKVHAHSALGVVGAMILGIGLYTIGSFLTWLFVGQLSDNWNKAVTVGSTVAIIGLVLMLGSYLLHEDDAAAGFASAITAVSIPIGFLAGRDGGPGFWVGFWIAVAGVVLLLLIKAARWLEKKCGT